MLWSFVKPRPPLAQFHRFFELLYAIIIFIDIKITIILFIFIYHLLAFIIHCEPWLYLTIIHVPLLP